MSLFWPLRERLSTLMILGAVPGVAGARAVAPVSVGLLYQRLGGYPAILVMLAAASVVAAGAAGRALAPATGPRRGQ